MPARSSNDAIRKLDLKGRRLVVFLLRLPQIAAYGGESRSLDNLRTTLGEQGYNLDKLPFVMQYNKRDDCPDISPRWKSYASAQTRRGAGVESCARTGGCFDTLKASPSWCSPTEKGGRSSRAARKCLT